MNTPPPSPYYSYEYGRVVHRRWKSIAKTELISPSAGEAKPAKENELQNTLPWTTPPRHMRECRPVKLRRSEKFGGPLSCRSPGGSKNTKPTTPTRECGAAKLASSEKFGGPLPCRSPGGTKNKPTMPSIGARPSFSQSTARKVSTPKEHQMQKSPPRRPPRSTTPRQPVICRGSPGLSPFSQSPANKEPTFRGDQLQKPPLCTPQRSVLGFQSPRLTSRERCGGPSSPIILNSPYRSTAIKGVSANPLLCDNKKINKSSTVAEYISNRQSATKARTVETTTATPGTTLLRCAQSFRRKQLSSKGKADLQFTGNSLDLMPSTSIEGPYSEGDQSEEAVLCKMPVTSELMKTGSESLAQSNEAAQNSYSKYLSSRKRKYGSYSTKREGANNNLSNLDSNGPELQQNDAYRDYTSSVSAVGTSLRGDDLSYRKSLLPNKGRGKTACIREELDRLNKLGIHQSIEKNTPKDKAAGANGRRRHSSKLRKITSSAKMEEDFDRQKASTPVFMSTFRGRPISKKNDILSGERSNKPPNVRQELGGSKKMSVYPSIEDKKVSYEEGHASSDRKRHAGNVTQTAINAMEQDLFVPKTPTSPPKVTYGGYPVHLSSRMSKRCTSGELSGRFLPLPQQESQSTGGAGSSAALKRAERRKKRYHARTKPPPSSPAHSKANA